MPEFRFKTLLLLTAALAASAFAHAQTAAKTFDIDAVAAQTAVPGSYFGMNLAGAAWQHPWPAVSTRQVRIFDAAWYHLEPQKGAWDFAHLDKDVEEAQQHHADLDLVLEAPPTWASARPNETNPYPWQPAGVRAEAAHLDDWAEYVRAIAMRYKGKVHTYELWNEPNQKDSYSGDIAHLVDMSREAYRVLKEVDPRITVISPSPAPGKGVEYLGSFLSQGGGSAFDVLGFHFYDNLSDPHTHPEGVLGTARALRDLFAANGLPGKPVWNTESGYYIHSDPGAAAQIGNYPSGTHVLGQDEAAAAVARSYLAGWAAGIGRFYWYAWAEPQYAFVDDGGTRPKKATIAFDTVEQWITGTRYQALARSAENVWTLTLLTPSNKAEHIVWTSQDPGALAIPPSWHATRLVDLAGKEATFGTAPVAIGPMPALVR